MTTMPRNDEQIQKDVLAELKWEPRLQPNEMEVSVKGGVVTLTGQVNSFAKRWAADEAAHRVAAVNAAANDIGVRMTGTGAHRCRSRRRRACA